VSTPSLAVPFVRDELARRHQDVFAILILVVAAIATTVVRHGLSGAPFEDAAMLMRYSNHLAAGHGIVWNVGAHPVDGATDFLFMVTAAGLVKAGIAVTTAVRTLDLVAQLLAVVLVYFVARKLHRASEIVALGAAGYIALGPASAYTKAGFGTPFFGLFVATSWALAYVCRRKPRSWLVASAFGLSCLLMGLTRPEGVVLAIFMLATLVWFVGVRSCRTIVTSFLAVFGGIGLVYFVWRWQYFGHPLPNPYYKKGDGHLHLDGLRSSIVAVTTMTFPVMPIYVFGILRGRAREAAFSLVPVFLFTAVWILLSNEMNFAGRFQYPVLMIVSLSWPGLVTAATRARAAGETSVRRPHLHSALAAAICLVFLSYPLAHLEPAVAGRSGNLAAGEALSAYSKSGYTLATTEAGLVPLYSNWKAIDTWGLNDPWIAHHGLVTDQYLDRYRPEVIMIHGYFSPLAPTPPSVSTWTRMTLVLRSYARTRPYVLAASFGGAHDTVNFYVRCDFVDANKIIGRIRRLRFYAYDFRRDVPNLAPPHLCTGAT
jgi:hypothetical protein